MFRRLALAIGILLLTSSAVPTSQGVTITSSTAPRDTDERTDVYGNDVAPAVATYSLDADGSPYEVHSPHTEIPRLGSPKS
jgi:hypothetical protein